MDIGDDPSALFVPEGDENSIDIYEGLDFCSGSNHVEPEKPPSGLKEAMDLFEEIVTEEQQNKEDSFTELKSRFKAAQSQLTELHSRLDKLQLQNTGLSKENLRLKMNISILLQTARQEVTRKDAEIQRLNQESTKGFYLKPRPPRDAGGSSRNQLPPPPQPADAPASSTSQRLSRPRPLPSDEAAASPAPLPALPVPPAVSEPPSLIVMPPNAAAPLQPQPPKEAPSVPDRPPLPPAPPSPPPPPPPLPTLPLRQDVQVPPTKDTEKSIELESKGSERSSCLTRRSLREDCRTSERLEKHRHKTDKHEDKVYKIDSERKGTATLNSSTDRLERRHMHKDRTSISADSKRYGKDNKSFTRQSDRDKGHSSKEGRSRDDRRDKVRDRQSRSSDSREGKHHRDSSRLECRLSKDQPSKEGRKERRAEDDGQRYRRDSKEKHKPKEYSKKLSKPSERPSTEKPISEKVVAEENSPHRKLSFMETLNLTLSPVKKVVGDCEGGQSKPDTAAETISDGPQPNMEDICVLDDVDTSEQKAMSVKFSEFLSEAPKVTAPDNRRNEVEETANSLSSTRPNELLDDNSVHCISTSKAEIQKEDSVPIGVKELIENSGETCTSANQETFSVNPAEASESFNNMNTSKSTASVLESAVPISEETKSCVPSESLEVLPKNSPLAILTSIQSRNVPSQESAPKEAETVSSSISLESLPQEGLSLPEAIDLLTQANEQYSSTASPKRSTTAAKEVSKVSSTTQETEALNGFANISKTPKKRVLISPAKFLSPPRSSEKATKSSSSVPQLYDEDSMMRTLSSLKKIPDAISPLRSPVRISKRNLQHLQKPGHVKSLHKEFSSAPADAISKKVDVNKENKHPCSPAKSDPVDSVLALPLDTDLEEGEILSDTDEATSPHPPTKKVKLKHPIRAKASPKCKLKRKTGEKSVKEARKSPELIPSPPNKSRFKTVSPAATKNSFSSIEEVMDTFKLVRLEIRKKYMKLHKTFPKKSFYGVMENFQESFFEFVDGADFHQLCNHTKDLKSKLKKVISSVFNKVSNNGIVKRIFEQQAVDLKQKLWDFVDVQVDHLFKEVCTTLKSLCKPVRSPIKHGSTRENEKQRKPSPVKRKVVQSPRRISGNKPCAVVPLRTGLGSRGKGIRITVDKSDDTDEQSGPEPSTVVSILSSTPENANSSLIVAPSTAVLDKTDFELLTEQQASSLTFNLVRDSQMGEIFKCLLQGSDLLDSNAASGDQSSWALATPRKDGERILTITTPGKFHTPSKLLTPSKFESPSKLIATWSSISPRKISSPSSKVLLNPALFDESCLLEVPSENKITQRPYSILAEDLAVSLTIPSPLKSDSHLSFLQPPSVQVLSTPESVLSAHICEDALLDEADATEHDIHLTLDTDNSSCCSSTSVGSCHEMSSQFLFKPNLPMQALVMERSTDHFIVKIRQTPSANSTLMASEISQTLIEEIDSEGSPSTGLQSSPVQDKNSGSIQIQDTNNDSTNLHKSQVVDLTQETLEESNSKTSSNTAPQASTSMLDQNDPGAEKEDLNQGSSDSSEVPLSQMSSSRTSSSDRDEIVSESERSLTIVEELESTPEKPQARKVKDRKRRKSQEKSRAKRRRTDEDSNQGTSCEVAGEVPLSPNSLSAKNVVRKKGEVVLAWTREEDRTILIELKTKGASRETFSFLSEKLDKPSAQIAQRFHQLMKLFKKMDT